MKTFQSLSWNTRPISIKLSKNISWVKAMPFLKVKWLNNIVEKSSRVILPISTNLGTKSQHCWEIFQSHIANFNQPWHKVLLPKYSWKNGQNQTWIQSKISCPRKRSIEQLSGRWGWGMSLKFHWNNIIDKYYKTYDVNQICWWAMFVILEKKKKSDLWKVAYCTYSCILLTKPRWSRFNSLVVGCTVIRITFREF